jgi:hypothetical protein
LLEIFSLSVPMSSMIGSVFGGSTRAALEEDRLPDGDADAANVQVPER